MKLKTKAHPIGILLLLALIPAPALASGDAVLGPWSMTTQLGEREIPATMTLSRGDDGELHGQWTSQGREMELTNITVEGDRIRFDREIPGGTVLHFEGTLSEEAIAGVWNGPFGEAPCSGERGAGETDIETDPDAIPDQHDRPIVEEDGRRLLWASEDEQGDVEWFDMTDSAIDPVRFQFGIGKDTIDSVDRPQFVPFDDPRLTERGVTRETEVLGVEIDGIARAYPVALMDMHEVVNDRFGETAFAVLW
jgi:hypothetical protein